MNTTNSISKQANAIVPVVTRPFVLKRPRVLVACEVTATVREQMQRVGCNAYSCDLLNSEIPGQHITGDVRQQWIWDNHWDAVIAFPDCTYLAGSGLHWNKRRPGREKKTEAALHFVRWILDLPVKYIALENPVGCISTRVRKPDQIIQPWQFGEDASKKTCLWLKGFEPLVPTNIIVKKRYGNQTASGQNRLAPSANRAAIRSRTYPGIAAAMADQWGRKLVAAMNSTNGV